MMILLSPEELSSAGFSLLVENPGFSARLCGLGMDEAHLIYWWGQSFRPMFWQIGLVQARMPLRNGHHIPVVAVTATLRVGEPMACICKVLGLIPGKYHFLRHSNVRNDIQLIFRELQSGLGGYNFPELDWLLGEHDNTVIFCKTISLGFKVACYLWAKASNLPNRKKHIRMFNSLNWPSYNSDTLGFLNNNQQSSITIATDTLSVGWDSKFTRNAVILGEPNDIDEFLQKIGRIGRNRAAVPSPRAFLYYSRGALSSARAIVDAVDKSGSTTSHLTDIQDGNSTGDTAKKSKRKAPTKDALESIMDITMARLLLAKCISKAIDEPYDNPIEDIPCMCKSCCDNPPVPRRHRCNCSGPQCNPENTPGFSVERLAKNSSSSIPKPPRAQAMSRELRAYGTRRLEELQWQLFESADESKYSYLAPSAFLPPAAIKDILDHFHLIKTTSDLVPFLHNISCLDQAAHQPIMEFLNVLQIEFEALRRAKNNETWSSDSDSNTDGKSDIDNDDDHQIDVGVTIISEQDNTLDVEEKEHNSVGSKQPSLRWKINFDKATVNISF